MKVAYIPAVQEALAAALAFLTVNLLMEASYRVVGAPRAAERFRYNCHDD